MSRADIESAAPLPVGSLRQFDAALVRVFTRDLRMSRAESAKLATEFTHALENNGIDGLPAIASRLDKTGIRSHWNHVLSRSRASALTSWILPHCESPVLDLLCGDGRVGECLATHGPSVTLAERAESYPIARNHALPFVAFDLLRERSASPPFSTVLLCTVLHHEASPDDLLRLAARLAQRRLIIVENCIEPRFPPDCQFLLDLFFSRCLNQFSLPAAGNHATAPQWLTRLASFGHVRRHERRESLPGIPLSHDLIVLDLDRGTA